MRWSGLGNRGRGQACGRERRRLYPVTGPLVAFEEFTTGGTSGGVTSYNSPPNDFGALTSTGSGGSLAHLYTAT